MAVAGGTASSVPLRLERGRLDEGAVMHRPRFLLEYEAASAIEALLQPGRSRPVYLALQGLLLPEVRAILTRPRWGWSVAFALAGAAYDSLCHWINSQ